MKLTKIASVGACSILLGWATTVAAAETPAKTTHSPESSNAQSRRTQKDCTARNAKSSALSARES